MIKQEITYDASKGIFTIGLTGKVPRIFRLGDVNFSFSSANTVIGRIRSTDETVLNCLVTEIKNPDTGAAFVDISEFDAFQRLRCYGPNAVFPVLTNAGVANVNTAANGTDLVQLPNLPCRWLLIKPDSTTIAYRWANDVAAPSMRIGTEGEYVPVTNANQLWVRRADGAAAIETIRINGFN